MLTTDGLDRIFSGIPHLKVAVLGDLFLDRYLDLDASLTEPSIETGLDAYQVTRVRSIPGAAGTIVNNLAAFGVQAIHVIAIIGDDGEGYELRQALQRMSCVQAANLFAHPGRRTPTYTKPMLFGQNQPLRELNRLDIKNRSRLPQDAENRILEALDARWGEVDAILVLDQVNEPECGVVTSAIRRRLAELALADPARIVLADSRERIGFFTNVRVKPNEVECANAEATGTDIVGAASRLADRCQRTVFCTRGEFGMLVAEPGVPPVNVPAFHVAGPVDTVGAGDSTSAALACALATGATSTEAAAFGNLVASITIQRLGTTGTASPYEIRQRWREVAGQGAAPADGSERRRPIGP